jgi:hypothetical protein
MLTNIFPLHSNSAEIPTSTAASCAPLHLSKMTHSCRALHKHSVDVDSSLRCVALRQRYLYFVSCDNHALYVCLVARCRSASDAGGSSTGRNASLYLATKCPATSCTCIVATWPSRPATIPLSSPKKTPCNKRYRTCSRLDGHCEVVSFSDIYIQSVSAVGVLYSGGTDVDDVGGLGGPQWSQACAPCVTRRPSVLLCTRPDVRFYTRIVSVVVLRWPFYLQ